MAGETDSMLGRVKAASEDAGIAPMAKEGMRKAYGDALLAADHLQEALPILRESAAAGAKAASTAGADENQVPRCDAGHRVAREPRRAYR